jgi:LacI family transcriptional regulator
MAAARSARAVRSSVPHRPRVALLIETSNRYGRDLLRGIRRWVAAHGDWAFRLVEQGRGDAAPTWLRDWTGDGIVARVENAAIARVLRAKQLPVIDVSAALPRAEFPRVATDNAAVARLAVEHFHARGLRHLAYCGAPAAWARERGQCFAEEVRGRGGPQVRFAPAAVGRGDDPAALAQWLRILPRPTGVFACYDVRGQQVLEACREAALRVPEEVAVLGVHNDETLCELCDPPLSSVAPDAVRAGYEAAAQLDRAMRGHRVPQTTQFIEPLGVVARQSTEVVAVADPALAAVLAHVRAHACEGIGVAEVLRAVPMARTRLEALFRRYLRCTPREHIEHVRLERVRQLLAETDLPIERIAERTGFEHPEYLSVVFRRVAGETPRAWRRQHRP